MLTHVSEGFSAMIEGGTDTEHLAAIYMTNLCQPADFRGANKHYPAASMWEALRSAIQTVEEIQTNRGKVPENYLNICASTCFASFGPQCIKHLKNHPSGRRVPPRTLLLLQRLAFNPSYRSLVIC